MVTSTFATPGSVATAARACAASASRFDGDGSAGSIVNDHAIAVDADDVLDELERHDVGVAGPGP